MDTSEILAIVAENSQLRTERRQLKKHIYDLENEVKRLNEIIERKFDEEVGKLTASLLSADGYNQGRQDTIDYASATLSKVYNEYIKPLLEAGEEVRIAMFTVMLIATLTPDGKDEKDPESNRRPGIERAGGALAGCIGIFEQKAAAAEAYIKPTINLTPAYEMIEAINDYRRDGQINHIRHIKTAPLIVTELLIERMSEDAVSEMGLGLKYLYDALIDYRSNKVRGVNKVKLDIISKLKRKRRAGTLTDAEKAALDHLEDSDDPQYLQKLASRVDKKLEELGARLIEIPGYRTLIGD